MHISFIMNHVPKLILSQTKSTNYSQNNIVVILNNDMCLQSLQTKSDCLKTETYYQLRLNFANEVLQRLSLVLLTKPQSPFK